MDIQAAIEAQFEELKVIVTKKTFWLGVITVAYGVAGYFTGKIDFNVAFDTVVGGFGLITIRSAIEKN